MKRLFVAIKVEPDKQFLHLYSAFKRRLSGSMITWVEPSVMHMTLKFLGKTEEVHLPAIVSALETVAEHNSRFQFNLDHLGIFGSSYQPRVIWIGSSQPQKMAKLGNEVIDGLQQAGFLRDRQNFVPHLSLGRIKMVDNKKYFQEILDEYRILFQQSTPIHELKLLQSILRPDGPTYQVVSSFKLKTP